MMQHKKVMNLSHTHARTHTADYFKVIYKIALCMPGLHAETQVYLTIIFSKTFIS